MGHARRKIYVKHDSDVRLIFLERAPKNPFSGLEKYQRHIWDAHRDEVMHEWIKTNPGTRPLYWWLYDAPEFKRKQLGGLSNSFNPALDHEMNYRGNKGLPEADWLLKKVKQLMFESEAAYLKRLKLFLPGEGGRLSKKYYKPINVGSDYDDS